MFQHIITIGQVGLSIALGSLQIHENVDLYKYSILSSCSTTKLLISSLDSIES